MFRNLGFTCSNPCCCDKDVEPTARYCKRCGYPLPDWAMQCGFAIHHLWKIRDHARKMTRGQGPDVVKLAYVALLKLPLEDLGHMLGVDMSEALKLLQSMTSRALETHGLTAVI